MIIPKWLEVVLEQLQEVCKEVRKEGKTTSDPLLSWGAVVYQTGKAGTLCTILISDNVLSEELKIETIKQLKNMLEPLQDIKFHTALVQMRNIVCQ